MTMQSLWAARARFVPNADLSPIFPQIRTRAFRVARSFTTNEDVTSCTDVHEMRTARMAMKIVKITGGGLSFAHSFSAVAPSARFLLWYLEPVSSVDSISEYSTSGSKIRPDPGVELGAWLGLQLLTLLAADFSTWACCCNVSCRRPPMTFSVDGAWHEGGCISGDRARSDCSLDSPILHALRPQNLQTCFWSTDPFSEDSSRSFCCMS